KTSFALDSLDGLPGSAPRVLVVRLRCVPRPPADGGYDPLGHFPSADARDEADDSLLRRDDRRGTERSGGVGRSRGEGPTRAPEGEGGGGRAHSLRRG